MYVIIIDNFILGYNAVGAVVQVVDADLVCHVEAS